VEFLFMTNFTLYVATDTYRQYYTELCNHAQNASCGCSQQQIPRLVIPASAQEIERMGMQTSATVATPTGTPAASGARTAMVTDSPSLSGTDGMSTHYPPTHPTTQQKTGITSVTASATTSFVPRPPMDASPHTVGVH